jgi:hypothetical protein
MPICPVLTAALILLSMAAHAQAPAFVRVHGKQLTLADDTWDLFTHDLQPLPAAMVFEGQY